MPADSASRTLVLSVVAVDLVGYSRKPVAEQMSLKDNFNHLLLEAIRDIPVAERIILDTGDGVAMGFLGDPEDALYVAMFMHEANNRDAPAIRIGINLGPVKLAIGIGGHPNIIGDGINVAERIMTFAEPGQFTASRPFFEIMSRMSGQYTSLFQFAGVHTDKQVRAHDVYLVGKSAEAFQQAEQGVKERAAQRAGHVAIPATPPAPPVVTTRASPKPPSPAVKLPPAPAPAPPPPSPAELVEHYSGLIDFLEDRKKVTGTAILLGVVAAGLGATIVYRLTRTMPAESIPVIAAVSPSAANMDPSSAAISPPGTAPAAKVATNVLPTKLDSKSVAPATAAAATTKETAKELPSKVDTKSVAPTAQAPAVKETASALPPKVETKSTPLTTPPAVPASAIGKPSATPAVVVTSPVRDQPTDSKTVKTDRVEKAPVREPAREDPRRTTARPTVEQNASGATTPTVSSSQAPVQTPRTEPVAPTPTPAPAQPVPVAPSTEALVVSRSAPPFPVEGIRQGIQSGFVKARLTIDARGNVTTVDILEAKPIPAFARETRQTLKDWKFNPGTPNRTYDIEISFKP